MKKLRYGILLVLALLLLTGCAAQETTAGETDIAVCLVQGTGYVAKEHISRIRRGDSASFQLNLQDGYEIVDCSYPDHTVTEVEGGFTLLTLHNVEYPSRVTLTCRIPVSVITFDPNGGAFAKDGSTEPVRQVWSQPTHPRYNTLSGGEKLLREGYIHTGWNTKPDGSGEHIGLGSRVSVEKNGDLTLYAQWEKTASEELFTSLENDDGVTLTAFLGGNTDALVIPDAIDGAPVTEIGPGFAEGLTIRRLVLPDTVLRIDEGAFRDCRIEHIVFFDTLRQATDASFENSRPRYWHINAVMTPRYQSASDITTFADKMDLLMEHAEERKLLLFAGCSMFYGVDSAMLEREFQGFTVLNIGAVGGTNAQFQFECILPYIREGDVFLHAPEQASSYQFMAKIVCENRMFIAVEGNFDLLSQVDMTTLGEGAFDCFCDFNSRRRLMDPCTYEDTAAQVSSRGDNAGERIASNTKVFDEKYGIFPELVTEESMDRLCAYYDRIRDAGGTVYLSYAPINALCCPDAEVNAEFARRWEDLTARRGYETISDLNDYMLDAKYFYDTDYHLTTAGAVLRTQQLIRDLEPVLEREK